MSDTSQPTPPEIAVPQAAPQVAVPQVVPTQPYVAPVAPQAWAPVMSPVTRPCPACGRDWGFGIVCQFCAQVGGLPSGVHLASSGRRFAGFLLEWFLLVITLVIGWLIWSLFFTFRNGQTPAKQVLGMRCVKLRTNGTASWGTMFLREFIAKAVIYVLAELTLGIVYFWLLWDKNNQELWDKMVGTIVVNDPQGVLISAASMRVELPPPG